MYVEFDLKGTFALILLVFVSYKFSVLWGFMVVTLCFVCCFCVSLFIDSPYNFLVFSKLVFRLFFGNKLENGLSHVWNRRKKVAKGWKR